MEFDNSLIGCRLCRQATKFAVKLLHEELVPRGKRNFLYALNRDALHPPLLAACNHGMMMFSHDLQSGRPHSVNPCEEPFHWDSHVDFHTRLGRPDSLKLYEELENEEESVAEGRRRRCQTASCQALPLLAARSHGMCWLDLQINMGD